MAALHAKQAEKLCAANEASQFQNYLELLVSVHKDCGDAWDWSVHAQAGPPPFSPPGNRHEAAALAEMHGYKPGFFEKLFGGDQKRLGWLGHAVERARATDQAEHAEAVRQHQAAHAFWDGRRTLATRMLARDASAYGEALEQAAAFEELSTFRTRVLLIAADADAGTLSCQLMDDEIVPREEVKLTSSGKLSTKAMAVSRYWTLYQDHVCSCALRVANETFAVLPVSRVVTNVGVARTNTSTGHRELATFLAVHFTRQGVGALNLGSIDPSDSMKNFPHRMKFKKNTGFELVEPMTADEQWVTT